MLYQSCLPHELRRLDSVVSDTPPLAPNNDPTRQSMDISIALTRKASGYVDSNIQNDEFVGYPTALELDVLKSIVQVQFVQKRNVLVGGSKRLRRISSGAALTNERKFRGCFPWTTKVCFFPFVGCDLETERFELVPNLPPIQMMSIVSQGCVEGVIKCIEAGCKDICQKPQKVADCAIWDLP